MNNFVIQQEYSKLSLIPIELLDGESGSTEDEEDGSGMSDESSGDYSGEGSGSGEYSWLGRENILTVQF